MTKNKLKLLEKMRAELLAEIDSKRTQATRNEAGQFATPPQLATDILKFAKKLLEPKSKVRFLEPGFGTGSFYSALLRNFPASRIELAAGFEKDPAYGLPIKSLWNETSLELNIDDFTLATPPSQKFGLVVCNPPYVRHHHLENGEKTRLRVATESASGMRLSGLAGLYCHFLGLAHAWMDENAIGIWLIPSEFMDVNYGKAVKDYLLSKVTLLRIHRFDPNDVQFADALVSSAIVCFRNNTPPNDHQVDFTFGGILTKPYVSKYISSDVLRTESKWTRFPLQKERSENGGYKLGDFFQIKRGLATGDNKFFLLTKEQIDERRLPHRFFRPILPSPRYLANDEIESDENGEPRIENQLFMLDSKMPEEHIHENYPTLGQYLNEGSARKVAGRYLCRHRKPWYSQENRPPAPIVCTYIGRSDNEDRKTFRFIRNRSQATAANSYLMLYPKPELAIKIKSDPSVADRIWEMLNQLPTELLLSEGRVYGGGMHKLEPKELANVPADEIAELLNFRGPPETSNTTLPLPF